MDRARDYTVNEFRVGDPVEKASGYAYPGVVVSVFETRAGLRRYVVEHIISEGMLHIFNGSQLKYSPELYAAYMNCEDEEREDGLDD